MGNAETSLGKYLCFRTVSYYHSLVLADFQKNVVELTSKSSNEDLDWDKLLPINTAKDLYTALQPDDIRSLRDNQPNVSEIFSIFF